REQDVARRLEHRARLDELRAMVSERLRGEPKTVKPEIWKAALDELVEMPLKPPARAGQERLAPDLAPAMYARRTGLPERPKPPVSGPAALHSTFQPRL